MTRPQALGSPPRRFNSRRGPPDAPHSHWSLLGRSAAITIWVFAVGGSLVLVYVYDETGDFGSAKDLLWLLPVPALLAAFAIAVWRPRVLAVIAHPLLRLAAAAYAICGVLTFGLPMVILWETNASRWWFDDYALASAATFSFAVSAFLIGVTLWSPPQRLPRLVAAIAVMVAIGGVAAGGYIGAWTAQFDMCEQGLCYSL